MYPFQKRKNVLSPIKVYLDTENDDEDSNFDEDSYIDGLFINEDYSIDILEISF